MESFFLVLAVFPTYIRVLLKVTMEETVKISLGKMICMPVP